MERGDINRNPMPKMEVLPPGVERVFDVVQRSVKFWRRVILNTNVPLRESSHYVREHFVDDPLATPAEVPTSLEAQLPLEGGWDDCGRYMNADGEF